MGTSSSGCATLGLWTRRCGPGRAPRSSWGGGYVGVEIAETLRSLEVAVTLITRGAEPMPALDAEMGARVHALLEQHGVGVRTATELTAIERRGERRVALTSSGELEADVVVLGLGSRPAVGLAAAAGIPLGKSGAVAVDHHQHTRVEGIYAAGDCAEAWHQVAQRWVNLHLGTVANKSGRIAGLNVAGGDARFPGVAGTAIVRAFDHEVARTGLSTREAAALGIKVEAQTIESHTASNYMPTPSRSACGWSSTAVVSGSSAGRSSAAAEPASGST